MIIYMQPRMMGYGLNISQTSRTSTMDTSQAWHGYNAKGLQECQAWPYRN